MLKNYNIFTQLTNKLFENAPRIPNSEEYWIKKGKDGKKVMIYFHDDLDGVYSAIIMKNYLESKGFEIMGYGIVNYQEGWSTTNLDPKYINIALDYAEDMEDIDVYMDHHGEFHEGDYKGKASVKTSTTSAYQGIIDQLGLPSDSMITDIIDMVDSAKYDEHGVDVKDVMDFEPSEKENKLEFAAAFNQLLKRSDFKTFIEVVANTTDMSPSIYKIFSLFKELYPANNIGVIGSPFALTKMAKDAGFLKDNGRGDSPAYIQHLKDTNDPKLKDLEKGFVDDAKWRLDQVNTRTRGSSPTKEYVKNQNEFIDKFSEKTNYGEKIKLPGYQILGQLVFVPSGTWANAIRIRTILEQDILSPEDGIIPTIKYHIVNNSPLYKELKEKDGERMELIGDIGQYSNHETFKPLEDVKDSDVEGIIGTVEVEGDKVYYKAKQPIFWMMLQYGNTMQIASFHKLGKYPKKYLPKTKEGKNIDNLGKYTENLLKNFENYFDYNINLMPNTTTKAGGHIGIGSISNIFGKAKQPESYVGIKFGDLFKNKIIQDLSGIPWNDIKMVWGDREEKEFTPTEEQMNKRTIMSNDIRQIDKKTGKIK